MLFTPHSDQNRFGFYRVGEKFCSYSMFESLEYANRTKQSVRWDFNNDFFQSIDWTQEPTASLQDLYIQRCHQLRQKYDYLVLWFSGGSDSHNILSHFVENDIHLDEVLIWHTQRLTRAPVYSETDRIAEIFLAAIPEAQRLLTKSPTTKLTVVDVSDLVEDIFLEMASSSFKMDFVYHANAYISPLGLAMKRLPLELDHYKKLYDQGTRIGFITGSEKPMVDTVDRRWRFRFFSRTDVALDIMRQAYPHPYIGDELFYWDPAAWQIPIKQCHEIRRFFQNNPEYIKQTVRAPRDVDNDGRESILNFFGRPVLNSVIKKIIYPYWRDDIIDLGKPRRGNNLTGTMMDWYIDRPISATPGGYEHMSGIQKLVQLLGHEGSVFTCNKQIFYSDYYYF